MDKLGLLYLLSPVIVGIIITQYRRELLRLARIKIFSDFSDNDHVMILVMSARDHFDQRQAIRETWASVLRTNETLAAKVSMKFVIGSQRCPIPPQDRLEAYSCSSWDVSLDGATEEERFAVSMIEVPEGSELTQRSGVYYLAFKVHHEIIISKLGAITPEVFSKIKISLSHGENQHTEIVSVTINGPQDGILVNGVRYKVVEPYLLPAGFEGVIQAHIQDDDLLDDEILAPNQNRILTDDGHRLIQFYDEFVHNYHTASDPLCSFVYKIHDRRKLLSHFQGKSQRFADWEKLGSLEEEQLEEEMETYADLLLLSNVLDVYRNLALKVLKAIKWSHEIADVDFVVKTDDDCFLHLSLLHDQLSARADEPGVELTWFGRFRHNWKVQNYGKWADREYASLVYPTFACGSMYAIGRSITKWLADNAEFLQPYQGEDVSMGIWLAAVRKHIVESAAIQCSHHCEADMIASSQLSVEDIRIYWQNLQICGNPCECR